MNDGGPAFPSPIMDFQPGTGAQVVRDQFTGMSLRDWFAGMALCGLCANSNDSMLKTAFTESKGLGETLTSQTFSRQAYEYADAMLKAREGGPC